MRARTVIAAAILALAPLAAPAQQGDALSMGQLRSPILTIDPERLFAETRYGQRIEAELRARVEALSAENERLRAELTAEERRLTERRPSIEVDAFRAEAEAFDARVQRIRAEQDAKQQALEQAVAQGRVAFQNAVRPVLAEIMLQSGAGVILDRNDVFLSAGLIEITDEAIVAVDAQFGDGTQAAPRNREGSDPQGAPDSGIGEAPADPATVPADGDAPASEGTEGPLSVPSGGSEAEEGTLPQEPSDG